VRFPPLLQPKSIDILYRLNANTDGVLPSYPPPPAMEGLNLGSLPGPSRGSDWSFDNSSRNPSNPIPISRSYTVDPFIPINLHPGINAMGGVEGYDPDELYVEGAGTSKSYRWVPGLAEGPQGGSMSGYQGFYGGKYA
jgi:hypothetical protein